jgi:carbonic anhydrase
MHKDELGAIKDEGEKYKRLVELNVQEQCINVIKTAEVQRAYIHRGIKVHGWVFDINSGELIDLKIDFDKLLKDVMEIYRLE